MRWRRRSAYRFGKYFWVAVVLIVLLVVPMLIAALAVSKTFAYSLIIPLPPLLAAVHFGCLQMRWRSRALMEQTSAA